MPPSLGKWLGLDSNQTYRSRVGLYDPEATLAPKPLTPKHIEQQKNKPPAQKSTAALDRKKTSPTKESAITRKQSALVRRLDVTTDADFPIFTRTTPAELETADVAAIQEGRVEGGGTADTTLNINMSAKALRTEATKSLWTLADVAKRLTKESSRSKTAMRWEDLLSHEEAKMGVSARRKAEEGVARLEASMEKLRGLCLHAAVPIF